MRPPRITVDRKFGTIRIEYSDGRMICIDVQSGYDVDGKHKQITVRSHTSLAVLPASSNQVFIQIETESNNG